MSDTRWNRLLYRLILPSIIIAGLVGLFLTSIDPVVG